MLRTCLFAVWFVLDVLRLWPMLLWARHLGKQGRTARRNALVRRVALKWAKRVLRMGGITLRVQGAEHLPPPDSPAMFAANHTSFLDVPVVLAALDRTLPFMAKTVIAKVPVIRTAMDAMDSVYVDPEDPREMAGALRGAVRLLKNGRQLMVFPEGVRSKAGPMGAFQPGAVAMAASAGVPVVPLAIRGLAGTLEGNRWRMRRVQVTLTVLPAVPTAGLSRAQRKALPALLEQTVRNAL